MLKTKIEWCDSTWNPVTGCLHGCEYCYARGIAQRFGGNFTMSRCTGHGFLELDGKPDNPYPDKFDPTLHRYRMRQPQKWVKPQNIFVCSMADLFGRWVPDRWIWEVLDACDKAPHHRYLFLTKYPERYCKYGVPIDENKWYGVSVTREADAYLAREMPALANKFVSIEPLLEDLRPERNNAFIRYANWIIIGAESGRRSGSVTPSAEWIDKIVWQAQKQRVPVFMKDSLIPIVGEESMIREFPWEVGTSMSPAKEAGTDAAQDVLMPAT